MVVSPQQKERMYLTPVSAAHGLRGDVVSFAKALNPLLGVDSVREPPSVVEQILLQDVFFALDQDKDKVGFRPRLPWQ